MKLKGEGKGGIKGKEEKGRCEDAEFEAALGKWRCQAYGAVPLFCVLVFFRCTFVLATRICWLFPTEEKQFSF